MILLFTPSGYLEITIFLFAVVAFVLAIRFFIDSRKRLQESFPSIINPRKQLQYGFDRSGFLIPKTAPKKEETETRSAFQPAGSSLAEKNTKQEIRELRQQLQQQQQELTKALQRMSGISHSPSSNEDRPSPHWEEEQKLESLRIQLAEKEAEIQRLKAQEMYAQKLREHYEEVQAELSELQEQMQQTEKQAWQAAELTIQLERAEQAQLQLETTLHIKEEKLHELTVENKQLQNTFHQLESRFADAERQRQQLLKKIQLLEELNADMMQLAETNRKLKTDVARVAELESMLQLLTQERQWLRK